MIDESRRLAGVISEQRRSLMTDQPQTWHYGLVARWWAEFNEAEDDELAFYAGMIE